MIPRLSKVLSRRQEQQIPCCVASLRIRSPKRPSWRCACFPSSSCILSCESPLISVYATPHKPDYYDAALSFSLASVSGPPPELLVRYSPLTVSSNVPFSPFQIPSQS